MSEEVEIGFFKRNWLCDPWKFKKKGILLKDCGDGIYKVKRTLNFFFFKIERIEYWQGNDGYYKAIKRI